MPTIHYLNVNEGDCSIIQHYSNHVTVIDVCNAKSPDVMKEVVSSIASKLEKGVLGNFNQKKYPVNPISHLIDHGINSIFRFIATHPDMDHLDGIKHLFETFDPINFWDTDNNAEKDFSDDNCKYNEEDWLFYKKLRDEKPKTSPKRLALNSGDKGLHFNQDSDNGGGDGLHILSPTEELVQGANECGDHNDCSYVILYRTDSHKIVFSGDSHNKTWEHILKTHKNDVTNIDLLMAPHHGRASDRDYDFLNVLKPKLTFFGNASSEDLAYDAWNSRKLKFITNNQAGSMVVNTDKDKMELYVTHEPFAKTLNPNTFYSDRFKAYYCYAL